MPGALNHSPAKIVRDLLVANAPNGLALGSDPESAGTWPVYYSRRTETEESTVAAADRTPDNTITVFDSANARDAGSTMTDGERQEHHGIQIMVRSAKDGTGWAKARAIAVALDAVKLTDGYRVTIGGSTYVIDCFDRTTDVISLGKEPNSNRRLFSINLVAMLWLAT